MSLSRTEMPVPGSALPALLQFMIRWTESLHGDGSLRETLIKLSDLALAEVVHLHRVDTATGAQRTIATVDRLSSQGARPLTRALGLALAGLTSSRAKPGTLWSMDELDRDVIGTLEPRALAWMEERRLREAMMIPLFSLGSQTDVLEFYMPAPLDRVRRTTMETLASAAAEAWSRRPEGRIARILRAAPAISEHLSSRQRSTHPLAESNPLGLTPAELRICGMIQLGTNLTNVSRTLGIADSTLRSHLSSIFSKAGVAGQVGLVRLLLEPEAERPSRRVQ